MSAIAALPFFGGTLSGFDPTDNTITENTSSGTFQALATCSLQIPANGTSYVISPTWPSAANIWVHCNQISGPGYNPSGGTTGFPFIDFMSAGSVVAQLTISNQIVGYLTESLILSTLQGVGPGLTQVGVASIPLNVVQTLDIHLTAGSPGLATLYTTGTRQFGSATLTHTSWGGIDSIRLWGGLQYFGSAGNTYWSQVIVDVNPTVGRFLRTDRLNTDSAVNTGWIGTVTNINEIPTSDANFNYATAAGQIRTYYENGLNLSGQTVLARGCSARARLQTGGPPNIQLALRSAGANYESNPIAAGSGFDAVFNSWTTDPATTLAWTAAGAAAVESGTAAHS